MRDICYISKQAHTEDGRPLSLNYHILISDTAPEHYGVKVIEKNSGEQAIAFDLTTEAKRICVLVDKLSQNSVTPVNLMDVLLALSSF